MVSTKWFDGAKDDLSDSYKIRRKVFIEEQKIDESLEFNGSDQNALTLVIYEKDIPVATGRIITIEGLKYIGRIAVLKEVRGQNYGDLLVRMLIRKAFEMGADKQFVHAQISARGFYEKIGFKAFGEEYIEDGIMHISMVHDGDVVSKCG